MLFTRKTLLDLPEDEHICTQRRRLLRGMAGGVVAMAAPGLANAARVVPSKQRALSFVHTHTGEEVSLVYKVGERFLPRSMASIAHLMRDFRSGAKPATIMHQISKGYSEEQLDMIAGWFAAQK